MENPENKEGQVRRGRPRKPKPLEPETPANEEQLVVEPGRPEKRQFKRHPRNPVYIETTLKQITMHIIIIGLGLKACANIVGTDLNLKQY